MLKHLRIVLGVKGKLCVPLRYYGEMEPGSGLFVVTDTALRVSERVGKEKGGCLRKRDGLGNTTSKMSTSWDGVRGVEALSRYNPPIIRNPS